MMPRSQQLYIPIFAHYRRNFCGCQALCSESSRVCFNLTLLCVFCLAGARRSAGSDSIIVLY